MSDDITSAIQYLRVRGYKVSPPDEAAVPRARRNAGKTSREGVARIRAGSVLEQVIGLYAPHHSAYTRGLTDDEMEFHLHRAHQSVSSARNTLVAKGLLYDSGETRKTRSGNNATVWKRTTREYTP